MQGSIVLGADHLGAAILLSELYRDSPLMVMLIRCSIRCRVDSTDAGVRWSVVIFQQQGWFGRRLPCLNLKGDGLAHNALYGNEGLTALLKTRF